ncbi:MAG: VOC family protein [Actinomycetota bacterium]
MTAASTLDCLRGGPVQMAYAVPDLHAAVAEWEAKGAGPFVVREHIEVEPAWFDHSSAYGWWGSVMVELVCVHAPAELGGEGLHHLAFFVDSFDQATAELTSAGYPAVLTARAGTTDFAFHDARASLGHLIEIYEGSAGLRDFYAHIRGLHTGG